MRKVKLKKLNNQGSTFVMAIIVITLVTMLAVAILTASTYNLSMKNMDRNSKDAFYTAETIMDEVCAGTGVDSVEQLGIAYEKVLTTLVNQDNTGFEYIVDNDEANKRFKTIFIESMLSIITNGQAYFDGSNKELVKTDAAILLAVKNYLESYIKGYDEDMAKILSVGSIEAYKDSNTGRSYMIIIRDVAIQYKEDKNGEIYFSNVTTDFEIKFPNMKVDFSATNRLDDFTKYVFIADDNIDVENTVNPSDPCIQLKAMASIYAGNLVDIKSNTDSMAEVYMETLSDQDDSINLICGGNALGSENVAGTISVLGSTNHKANFYAENTNIWCTNIRIKPNFAGSSGVDQTKGGYVNIADSCNSYVKDDLSIDGQDSEVVLNGTYYGYSFEGSGQHSNSSAMIINGKRAKLTIGTDRLLLAGHSYIEIAENDYQMMGEALSFRGDQEIYLIPSEYLGYNYGMPVPNPMSKTTWDALLAKVAATAGKPDNEKVKVCKLDNFFAYKRGYVNTSAPYTVKYVGNDLVYLYVNFRSDDPTTTNKQYAAKYVYDIANATSSSPADLRNLNRVLGVYTDSLFKEGANTVSGKFEGSVKINSASSTLYTNGTLLNTNSSALNGGGSTTMDNWIGASSATGNYGNDQFTITEIDLENRYSILTHLLADLPWTEAGSSKKYIVNDIESALWQMKNYFVSGTEMSATNIFNTIVDSSMISAGTYNKTGITFDHNGQKYVKVVTDTNFTIDSSIKGGIVVSTGDVTVLGDFAGMIIAGKNIYVRGDATVTNNMAEVQTLIKNDHLDAPAYGDNKPTISFKDYFYSFKHGATEDDSSEGVKVENVDYKDIVKTNNWRKYED